MAITRLTIPTGITPPKVINVPDDWSATWFRSFIKIWMQSQGVGSVNELVAGTKAFILGSDGSLTVASSEGTAGYVLTSQGPGNPAHWAPGGAGSGTVTSVALADGSTSPIFTISGSPVTTSGTLTATLATQSANKIFAGPTTGAAAQPTFRSLVLADIPTIPASQTSGFATVATSGAYSDLSGKPSIPAAANPTALIGLTAVNGAASTFMRSDAAPALDVTISPTWTGAHTFTPSGAVVAATINGAVNQHGLQVTGGTHNAGGSWSARIFSTTAAGFSNGLWVGGGTNSSDTAFLVENGANNTVYFKIFGDGGITGGNAPTGGDKGVGTINVSGGYYVNGVLIGSGSGTGANVQVFTSAGAASQTYTLPVGATVVRVYCIGGGAGGGSGASNVSSGNACGGGGGTGGGVSIFDFAAASLGASQTITFSNVATGGNGGAAKSSSSAGANGVAGSNAEFGTLLIAYGGNPGTGGPQSSSGGTGGAVGQSAGTGLIENGTAGGNGSSTAPTTGTASGTSTTGQLTGYSPTGGGGGGGGGASASAGGAAGGSSTAGSWSPGMTGGTAGAAGNHAGGNGNASGWIGTGGGGGGGATGAGVAAVAGAGGPGAIYGGGGGGGGGASSTTVTSGTSGAGGQGGAAAVICIAW